MSYDPQVNDYVIWHREDYDHVDKGWVYFKCDEYITIEIGVRPKPNCEYSTIEKHKYIHTLLLCFNYQWKDLEFVTKRNNQHDPVTVPEVSTNLTKPPKMPYIRRVKGNTHEQRSVISTQSKSS